MCPCDGRGLQLRSYVTKETNVSFFGNKGEVGWGNLNNTQRAKTKVLSENREVAGEESRGEPKL